MTSPVRRALLSVHDKSGLVPFARALHEMGIALLSTGGTAKMLEDAGLPVVRVADQTGFPEMLDGRVKTLHPRIHAGILAIRGNAEHMRDLAAHGIETIDLVVVNLYPFAATAADPSRSLPDVVEMIDIGGPSMVRGAAKNWEDVGVIVDAADYPGILAALREHGGLTRDTRLALSAKAFAHTASYDAAVAWYLGRAAGPGAGDALPGTLGLVFPKASDLVYGENPHQKAAFYRDPAAAGTSLVTARPLAGKPLSFNNILDFDAALSLAADLGREACVIVKHGNPCGVGLAERPDRAFRNALACDPTSAFGGVIAFGDEIDGDAASAIVEAFYEGVLAPGFSADAIAVFAKKKNLRLLETGPLSAYRREGLDLRRVQGGMLAQEWDRPDPSIRQGKVATKRAPTDAEWSALQFAWTVVRHVKSNAIVYAFADRTVGIGAGQMSRVDSARFGIQKAQTSLRGAAMASDAFFPFRDGLDVAAEAGITAVVQPGGSIRDDEVVQAADERGVAMVLVGRRHFRH
ncbi:MAG TPA: bifunctional phosphoribosylaminoimidazolecarboxamide formyltransferase/IMP cyclohydrolase [Candidatus Polarisedimenticolaceae bacterium]|nr:bifunctional phosphoribosylaminoimidazolecarboxamide formyltransferase/IMP cyclohydrolase [Candidatus Polarisedimenticolaceae bacterium]